VAYGTRINLTGDLQLGSGQFAQLFIPDYYQNPADGRFTLVFHCHSASWAAEDEIYKVQANAVLFNIHLGALSSPYQNYFTDPTRFEVILNLVKSRLQSAGIIPNPQIENLIVTSFSAGYAGVREILKQSAYYQLIDALHLADGLHSSSGSGTMTVQMQDFLTFARAARDGQKTMLMTHSSIPTSGYQSTTQTADYLIQGIGAVRESCFTSDIIGQQYSCCDTGDFHLKGYYGDTADDHMKHLYAMHLMIARTFSLLGLTSSEVAPEYDLIDRFELEPVYPNPFNPATTIGYRLQQPSEVLLAVYDLLGSQVACLVQRVTSPGNYSITWDASGLASGVYLVQLRTPGGSQTRRCIKIE